MLTYPGSRVFALLCLSALACNSLQPGPQPQLAGAISSPFDGLQFREYQWLTYPVSEFGIASAYRGQADRVDDRAFLSATFATLSIAPAPTVESDWMRLARGPQDALGFADVGCGGPVTAQVLAKAQQQASAMLPSFLRIVDGSISADLTQGVTTTLSIGSACNRKLRQQQVLNYITAQTADPLGTKSAYESGRLVLVVADLVAKDLELKVQPTSSSALGAKLRANIPVQGARVFGDSTALQLSATQNSDGTFTLKTTRPVVVAILPVHEPPPGTIPQGAAPGAIPEWAGWSRTTVPEPPRP